MSDPDHGDLEHNGLDHDERYPFSPLFLRPGARTLRYESFPARFERLRASAKRHGVVISDVVLPAEGMIDNQAGMALHYLEWPPHPGVRPDAPTVILLHGGGLHAHTFDLVGNLLRRRARCLAFDLRGHGDSDWAGAQGYGTEAIADDIDDIVAALELGRVVVAGHSMGGMGALVWAARGRPSLAGLVVLDVAPGMDHGGAASVGAFITTSPTFADLDEVDDFVAATFPGRTAGAEGMVANLRWDDDGRLAFKYDTHQFGAADLALGDDLRSIARRIICPTRILRGERSKVLGDEAAAELADLIDGATWAQIPEAGHTIQSSNPLAVATEIAAFLDHLALPAPSDPVDPEGTPS